MLFHRRWRSVAVAALVAIATVALLTACSSPSTSSVPASGQQVVLGWTGQHQQMWTWMQDHWSEMAQMHEHWGDAAWMQEHLSDYPWMQEHWSDMAWMHDHWGGMMALRQGMMGSPPSGMMGA